MVYNIQTQNTILNKENEDNNLQQILNLVYENIDQIMEHYDHILNPATNSITQKYINQGYQLKEAYALSFTFTLSLYIHFSNT